MEEDWLMPAPELPLPSGSLMRELNRVLQYNIYHGEFYSNSILQAMHKVSLVLVQSDPFWHEYCTIITPHNNSA